MRNELKLEIKKLSKRAFDKERKRTEKQAKYREKFERRTDQVAKIPIETKKRYCTDISIHDIASAMLM